MPPSAKTIMVVDDEALVASVLREFLQDDIGYRVEICDQAAASYPLIKERQPALVILDMRLPGQSGLGVLDRLKSDPSTAGLPVLLCSASSDELRAAESKLRERGVGVMAKPFDLDALAQQVEELIGPPELTGGSG